MTAVPIEARKRPIALLATMLLCTMMAMGGMANGFTELVHFRSTTTHEAPLRPGVDAADHEAAVRFVRAWGEALDRARSVRLPLSIANLLLSGLLLVATSRASGGRPGSRGLALQAVGANAALAVADFVLSRHYRGDVVAACAEYWSTTGLFGGAFTQAQLAERAWSSFRLQLGLALGAYASALAALYTRRAREYLAPLGPGNEGEGDE